MKNEKGITLVSLTVIIILLIIMASVGIYTGISSYKVIDIQKFKSQLQMIQNEIDELYEKNKNDIAKGKEIEKYEHLKVSQIYNNESETQRGKILKEFWDNNKIQFNLGDQEEYYIFSAVYIESEFRLSNIDISEYFIINLKKRLVFSTTPIKIEIDTNKDGVNDSSQNVYCLYQLDEEEKVVQLETDGNKYSIKKEDYKQIIEITNDINIEKIEVEVEKEVEKKDSDGNVTIETEKEYVNINSRKDYCTKVSGLGTGKVTIEIIKDCKIKMTDVLGKEQEKEFRLYNTPVLDYNMVPFILGKATIDGTITNEGGILCYENSPEWYDYNEIDNITFATVAIVADKSIEKYQENINISDTSRAVFDPSSLEIKVWIPKNLAQEIKDKYKTDNIKYDVGKDFEDVTGIWVNAEAQEITDVDGNTIKKYIPKEY